MTRIQTFAGSSALHLETLEDRLVLDNSSFVNALYVQVLGRVPAQAEVNSWTESIRNGRSQRAVVTSFINSSEAHGAMVEEAYETFLNRDGDASGRAFWQDQLGRNLGSTQLGVNFLTSKEYTKNHANDAAFVAGLYQDVLLRSPDSAGQSGWLQVLSQGRTRANVANDFLTSSEYVRGVVESFYLRFLHRPGEEAEVQSWVNAIHEGQTLEEVAADFLLSAEYQRTYISGHPEESRIPSGNNLPIFPEFATPELATFVDPTAQIIGPRSVTLGVKTYIAPFAVVDASAGPISIGSGSDVQDNTLIRAGSTGISIGDQVMVAHGATVLGNAQIGSVGGKPAFIGFNAWVDGAIIEGDTYLSTLAKVAPGITIHSGTKVLPGKFIMTQEEADDRALGKVTNVTEADRTFMQNVLHVNQGLEQAYTNLVRQKGPMSVYGINLNPGRTDFNPVRHKPILAGVATIDPEFPNRIIGGVILTDTVNELNKVIARRVSIRADEGEPFTIGSISAIGQSTTFHALEGTEIQVGDGFHIGSHAVVHGGDDSGATPTELTQIENNVTVDDWAVVFRSNVGSGSQIGFRALIDGSQLAPGTVVPDRAIIINNVNMGFVEW